jgi:hypothetical protein
MSNGSDGAKGRKGQKLADHVYGRRLEKLRTRARALQGDKLLGRADAEFSHAELLTLNAANKGLLLGLGDSWFDYFTYDALDTLKNRFGYTRASVAAAGMSLKKIVESPTQLELLSEEIEKTVGTMAPKAILVSGGGNDLVDFGIGNLLNDFTAGSPALIEGAVRTLIDEQIRDSLASILDSIHGLCQRWLNKTIPIVIHGYAYPIPDGRYLSFPEKRGPWLEPRFLEKRYDREDLGPRKAVMTTLIDRLNRMQLDLIQKPEYKDHVKHVDLRDALDAADYKTMWENELHPQASGFRMVAERFDRVLRTL